MMNRNFLLGIFSILLLFACKEENEPELVLACEIRDVEVTVGECTCDTTYQATIDFIHENASSDFLIYMLEIMS